MRLLGNVARRIAFMQSSEEAKGASLRNRTRFGQQLPRRPSPLTLSPTTISPTRSPIVSRESSEFANIPSTFTKENFVAKVLEAGGSA